MVLVYDVASRYDLWVMTSDSRARILEFLAEKELVSSGEVGALLGVTRQTAHRHLVTLVRSGDLVRQGSGRGTRYALSPARALPTIAAQLDEAVDGAGRRRDIGGSVRKRLVERDGLRAIAWGLDYFFVVDDGRSEDIGPFRPLLETPNGRYPPPVEKVEPHEVALWGELSGLVTHPFLRARLNDLLWERKWSSRPDMHARWAIEAYLDLTSVGGEALETADALGRARVLARQIGDEDLLGRVVEAALQGAEEELQRTEPPRPGIVLRLLDVALHHSGRETNRRAGQLLQRAKHLFNDPWIQDHIIARQLSIADSRERTRELQRQAVDLWLGEASSVSGMKHTLFLEEALKRAQAHGLHDSAERIRVEIQEYKQLDHDEMQSISVQVDLPTDYIEQAISWISSADSWGGCLQRLVGFGPLSGNLKQNIDTVRRHAREFPLKRLMTYRVIGPWNETVFAPTTEGQWEELDLSRYEKTGIDMASHILAGALDRIQTTHGQPQRDELQAFFTTPIIDQDTAERMAASVGHYARGCYDDCVMVLLPRIERAVRELVRRLGAPIWREPQTSKKRRLSYGQQRTLRALLLSLKGHLDEDWHRYLTTLLINPLGSNLRNIHAHGLVARATREEAAALIHVAAYLALLELTTR